MPVKNIEAAICYDFDGTLAPGYMQHHSLLPALGYEKFWDFWQKAKTIAKKNDGDEILAWMQLMLKQAKATDQSIHRDSFIEHGKGLPLFPGVEDWFKRINSYAKQKGIILKHYIISSGLRELIQGTSIAKEFEYIFASGFQYDQHGIAEWPALAVNYTTKTQFLFRVNKGIKNSYDNAAVNKYFPENERPMPFHRMVFIGDGETDVPSMKMTKYQGGHAIAVYQKGVRRSNERPETPKDIALKLIKQGRADYAAPADYTEDSDLNKILQSIIDKIATDEKLLKLKG